MLQANSINAVGGGLALYRRNAKNELEILLVKDPKQYQRWRQGFEFPAGTIGDYGHQDVDGIDEKNVDNLSLAQKQRLPIITFLKGSIREALEELVYLPAAYVVSGSAYDSHRKINKNYSKRAIDAIAQEIKQQGLICLKSLSERSNYNIYFWNVSHLPSKLFLQNIEKKRAQLISGWFQKAGSIGAEPNEFAWVSTKELQKVIDQARSQEKNISRVSRQYFVTSSEYIKQDQSLQTNKKIALSPGFVGLIAQKKNNSYSFGDGKVLSMSEIITIL